MLAIPFNAILWCSRWTLTSSNLSSLCVSLSMSTLPGKLPHNRDPFLFLPREDGEAEFRFVVCLILMLASNLFVCISIFLDRNFLHVLMFVFLACMFRVPKDSPICVLTTDIFSTSSMTFEIPSYVTKLAHHFVEAPSPPPSHTHIFSKLV